MTIENIGLERLPNIYFKKINLEDHDTKSFKVVSELIILDEATEGSFIWSIDPLFSGFMKTCVIEVTDLDLMQQITDGVQNPHPSLLKLNPLSMEGAKIHIFGFKDFIKMEDEDDKHFHLKTSLIKPNEMSNLTLFAFNYIDHKEISNYLHIKLTGPLQQYMGPLVSETVMVNRGVQETSTIFKKPNQETWSGPVHQGSDGKWYSGASINSEETVELKRNTIRNTKLTDVRTAVLKNRGMTSFTKLSIFGNLMTSLNSKADLFGTFSINMKQMIMMKTKSGRQIYGLGDKMFSSFLDSIVINSIEIRRRQVRLRKQANLLGTAKFSKEDILPYTTIAATQEKFPRSLVENENIKEITITQDKNIRTFQFADFEKTEESRGEFIYEAHLTFLDKSQQFLESLILDMERILNNIKAEVRILNKTRNYNEKLDRLEVDPPTTLNSYVDQYYEFFSILKDLGEEAKKKMSENKKTLFKKQTYKKRFGLSFIEDWEKLITNFRRKFGVYPSSLRQSKSSPSSAYPSNLISLSKTFDNKIDFNSIKASYDILGVVDNKEMVVMTKDDFLKRGDKEIDRFFDLSNSQASDEMLDMDKEDSNAIKDLETSKMGFLSPISFQIKGKRKDITDLANIDLDDISVGFLDHMSEVDEKKISISKPKIKRSKPRRSGKRIRTPSRIRKRRIKFNFRPRVLKINNLKVPEHLDSSKYLGDNSEFVNVENNLDKVVEPNDTKQANNRFRISNELSIKRSKNGFDLREKNNFYEKFKSSKGYTPKKLRRIPVGIKSIFNSRSKAAKNNIMDEDTDILKMVDTKVSTEMIFHANQKIEALIGYEKAPDGTDLMNRPIWGEVTKDLLERKKTILCRSTYLEMPELGIVPAPEFRLKVQNEIFIIEGDGTEESGATDISEDSLPEVDDIVYASSNVVIQPNGVSNA
mgnify:CR=1 FL=1